MADKTHNLAKGHRVIVRRGPRPGSGWLSDANIDLTGEGLVIPGLTVTPPPPPPPDEEEPPPPPDEEEPPPPTSGDVVGYGKIARGGTKAAPVRNLTELRAAAGHSDNLIQLQNPIDLGAGTVDIATHVTIEGKGEASTLGNGWLRAVGDDIILRQVAAWCGDKVSTDGDTFNANGSAANPVERLVIDHCLFLWGVDVTVVFLNAVNDFTMQNSVIAEGLYLSKHSEATVSQGGHSMSLNCTDIGAGVAPKRGTFYRNALLNSADRNGRFMGAEQIDLIENLLFGWKKAVGFHGAPKALNCVNNLFVKGSQSAVPIAAFTPNTSADVPKLTPDSIYVAGNVAVGFTLKSVSGLRTSPKFPLSVQTSKAPTLDEALSWVGPSDRGKQMQRLIADAKAGRSEYVNGTGKGGKEYASLL